MKETLKKIPLAKKLAKAIRGIVRGRPTPSPRDELLRTLPKNSVGAEIGVHLGDFSEKIIKVATPKRLYLIDPWKYESGDDYKSAWYGGVADGDSELDQRYESVKERFAAEIQLGRIEVIRKPSTTALADIPDSTLDFTYIDGNHLYQFVKEDLELSFQKVKQGGLITGDDYGIDGWWKDGVEKAVDEFCQSYPVSLVWIKGSQFVIRKTNEGQGSGGNA